MGKVASSWLQYFEPSYPLEDSYHQMELFLSKALEGYLICCDFKVMIVVVVVMVSRRQGRVERKGPRGTGGCRWDSGGFYCAFADKFRRK